MGKQRVSKRTKSAEGLALNTIAIAAIVLVVLLIVLSVIYSTSNKTLPFFSKQTDCTVRSGSCIQESGDCGGTKVYGLGGCPEDKPVCCIQK